MKREVYVSMDKKNWIFIYTRFEGKFYTIDKKLVSWVTAHTPTVLFDYARVLDWDLDKKLIRDEIRELTK